MMNQPPIDALARTMGDNKYKLCCVLQKRAKELEKTMPDEFANSDKKSITYAAEDILAGRVISNDNN